MRTAIVCAIAAILTGCQPATIAPAEKVKVEAPKSAPVVDLVGVANDAADNPLAIEKYKGSMYRVSGELLAIDRLPKPSTEIMALFTQRTYIGETPVIGVAVFPDSEFPILSELKIGERITIEGAFFSAKYNSQYRRESWNVTFIKSKLMD